MISNRNLYIVSIIISIPFILWAILQILPTFDDWTTLSLPNYDPDYPYIYYHWHDLAPRRCDLGIYQCY